jgi:signal transduction histidine kinase
MRAEVAAELAASDPAGAERVLAEMRVEVQGALGEIRRLVDALRPPALDELGLVGALQAQAGRLGPEPTVDVAAHGPLPDLPAAIEVAAYRIAVEAMTNAARHARARSCHVRLTEAGTLAKLDRSLEVEITDDGAGIARDVRPGIGLLSMRERASEVGGTCVVEAAPDGGTRVFARLPLVGLAPSAAG